MWTNRGSNPNLLPPRQICSHLLKELIHPFTISPLYLVLLRGTAPRLPSYQLGVLLLNYRSILRFCIQRSMLPAFWLDRYKGSLCPLLMNFSAYASILTAAHISLFIVVTCSLVPHFHFVAPGGIEPPTRRFSVYRSTTELQGHMYWWFQQGLNL